MLDRRLARRRKAKSRIKRSIFIMAKVLQQSPTPLIPFPFLSSALACSALPPGPRAMQREREAMGPACEQTIKDLAALASGGFG